MTLGFSAEGMTSGLVELQDAQPGLQAAFQLLTEKGWHGRKITSSMDNASLWDIFFLAASGLNMAVPFFWFRVEGLGFRVQC